VVRTRFHCTSLLVGALLVAAGCSSSKPHQASSTPASASANSADKGETSARELFARGNDHLDAGEWDSAIEAYESALDVDSERWDIWLNLAIAYSKAKSFEDSLDAIEKSLANGGEGRPEVYYNLGNIYQRRGFYRQAIKTYRTSLAHADEPSAETLTNIGAALLILDQPDTALDAYERAQRLAPQDHRIQHGIAICLYHKGEDEASVDAFDKLNEMAPEFAMGYFDKAKPLVRADQRRDAIRALETYLEKASDGKFAPKAKTQIEILREKIGSAEDKPEPN